MWLGLSKVGIKASWMKVSRTNCDVSPPSCSPPAPAPSPSLVAGTSMSCSHGDGSTSAPTGVSMLFVVSSAAGCAGRPPSTASASPLPSANSASSSPSSPSSWLAGSSLAASSIWLSAGGMPASACESASGSSCRWSAGTPSRMSPSSNTTMYDAAAPPSPAYAFSMRPGYHSSPSTGARSAGTSSPSTSVYTQSTRVPAASGAEYSSGCSCVGACVRAASLWSTPSPPSSPPSPPPPPAWCSSTRLGLMSSSYCSSSS
mmetsp:Transcript_79585/g.227225  ORF Transcript_79585/g.227225 Transcript_79585/m.227225 type:complete len:259 (-) Transcript_79585:262-1038(-)